MTFVLAVTGVPVLNGTLIPAKSGLFFLNCKFEGVSLAAQTEKINKYCAFRGLRIEHAYCEEGVSGSVLLKDRPAGALAVVALGPRKARHIVALKMDRLFRNAADALNQTQEWDRMGVALHLVDMGGHAFDTKSAMGRFFFSVMAACAELELSTIRERTSSALLHMRAQRQVYGAVPLGYDRVGARLEPNAYELGLAAGIRDSRAEGMSLRAIAAALNAAGIPTHGRLRRANPTDAESERVMVRGRWHASTVAYILRNALYR